jgi:hypothetical protein
VRVCVVLLCFFVSQSLQRLWFCVRVCTYVPLCLCASVCVYAHVYSSLTHSHSLTLGYLTHSLTHSHSLCSLSLLSALSVSVPVFHFLLRFTCVFPCVLMSSQHSLSLSLRLSLSWMLLFGSMFEMEWRLSAMQLIRSIHLLAKVIVACSISWTCSSLNLPLPVLSSLSFGVCVSPV